jgi:hypothetical protein
VRPVPQSDQANLKACYEAITVEQIFQIDIFGKFPFSGTDRIFLVSEAARSEKR